jgi:hydrogenase maturation protein HypF
LGVIWDGAGYGPDGTIWGGEFLLGDAAGFRRVGSLRPFRLLGGDAAARQPRRVAFALLWEMFGDALEDWQRLAPLAASSPEERRLWAQMLRQAINAPITSSAGRLLDGIASLIGLHQQVSFEGQAAMALEFIADRSERGAYPLPLSVHSTEQLAFAVDWQPLLAALLADLRRREEGGIMAARVLNALSDAIVGAALLVGERRVALSGGCFQNRWLTEQCCSAAAGCRSWRCCCTAACHPTTAGSAWGRWQWPRRTWRGRRWRQRDRSFVAV